ncbi:MAG: ammonium transporter [Crocinitomicaceae bacterium]|jgi:Amt family ammonium transporter|nr:ammonium transporter [Crocinitomicaceae bacterium]MDG1735551.1 ammonium transporter [Crocinitomicaceae bacterium]
MSSSIGRKINFIFLAIVVFLILIGNKTYDYNVSEQAIDSGDTAWMLVSSAFVLLMTPGLAFFYGGMVNVKNIISTMLQSFVALGVITVVWVFVGFSLSFGDSIYGIIGNPTTFLFFENVTLAPNPEYGPTIPFLLFAFFQLKFAIITPALISGSFAERIRFRSYILFMLLFTLLIYTPLAHMTWHPEGLFRRWGVIDFAGGTVVHMSAGLAALAGALFLGKRKTIIEKPANIPFVILGTGLLWFGWFGFNAGSALGANFDAVVAFANTNVASATSMITWIFFDRFTNRKMSAIGACIGAIVGLVAITPAAGVVTLGQSMFIGFVAALISNLAIRLFRKLNIDDTLDVFPSHGIGGITGMILTALFASEVGLIYGETETFVMHLVAILLVVVYTLAMSYFLFKIVNLITPLRVREDQEERGLDASQHGEHFL